MSDETEPPAPTSAEGELENHSTPPEISPVWKRARIPGIAMAGLAWVVVLVFWGQHFYDEPEPPAPDRVRYGDIAVQLQLLLQGKVVIGQAMALPQTGATPDLETTLSTIAEEVETLDGAAARALAALHIFVKPDDTDGALAQLDAVTEFEPGEVEVHALARKEITAPGTLTQSELDELQYQMHWFAHPLLLAKEDGQHPERQQLMMNIMVLMVFAGAVGLAFVIAFFVGLVLLVILAVRCAKGNSPFTFDESQGGSRGQIWGFIAYLGVMGSPILLIFLGIDFPLWAGLAFVVSIVAGVVVAMTFSRGSFRERRRALGIHTGRGVFREIGSGIVGYCCVLPIGLIGGLISLILWWVTSLFPPSEASETVTGHPIGELFFDAPVMVRFGLLMLAAVAAPLIEETMFRGVLHRGLRRSFSLPIAGLIGAVCFAAVHPQDIVALPVLAALGFGFMLIREWRDSLIGPMVAHGLHNGTLMAGLWIGTM